MKKLYRFEGYKTGIFVADEKDVAEATGDVSYQAVDWPCCAHDVWHLTPDDFEVLSDDQEFIEKFERLGCATGENPLLRLWDQRDLD